MALAFDAVGPSSSGSASGGSPRTWAHVCTGSNLVLYVGIAVDYTGDDTGSTVTATYNSVSMTSVQRWHSGGAGKINGFIEVFKLVNPSTGSNTVSVSISGGSGFDSACGGSISFSGASQATPNGAVVTADSAGSTVTSGTITVTGTTSGNIVAAFLANGSGGTSFTTGTSRFVANHVSGGAAGTSAGATNASSGGSVSVGWNQTSDWFGAVAFEVMDAGGAAVVPPGPPPVGPALFVPMAWQAQAAPLAGIGTVIASGTDTGSGADTGSVVASLPDGDTGTGAETGTISLTGTDTGSGADTGSVVASLTGADTGAGADTGSVAASLSDGDTGTGADTGSVQISGAAPPSGPPPTPPGFVSPMTLSTFTPMASPVRPTSWRLMDGAPGRPGNGPDTATAYSGNFIAGTVAEVTEGGCWFEGYWLWVCPSGQATTAVKCALWYLGGMLGGGTTETVIPGSVITSGTLTAGQWNYIPLTTPVQLSPGTGYVAAIGINGAFPYTANQFGAGDPYGGGITNGPLNGFSAQAGTNPGPYSFAQMVFSTSGSDPSVTIPTAPDSGGDHAANLWVDLQVRDSVPTGYSGTYRLWPNSDVDASTELDSSVNYVIGTEIRLSQDCDLTKFWFYSPAGTAQLPTACDVWSIASQTSVAGTTSPSWSGAAGSGWVSCTVSGAVLPAGAYRVTVYNGAAVPDAWSAKRLHYWGPNSAGLPSPGLNGIPVGPLYAPPTATASTTYEYNGDAGGTPAYSNGTQTPGQSVFAVGPPNQYPYLYVGGAGSSFGDLYQNYWVDLEVIPGTTASGADTGTGADTGSVTASVPGADTGTGIDTGSVTAALTGTDTGSGADTGSVLVLATTAIGSPLTPPGFGSPMAWQFQRQASITTVTVTGHPGTVTVTDTAADSVTLTDQAAASVALSDAAAATVTVSNT